MITIAQAGIGMWGQNHLRVFASLPECAVRICCDQHPEALKKAARIVPAGTKLTSRFADILKDKAVEAVIITTPSHTHAALTLKALRAGKHVFVEKPLALTVADGLKMVEEARRAKRILMVGHLLLYHPAVLKIKSLIEDGSLGDIRYMYSTRVNLGQVRAEENALWSLTAHDISVANFFLKKTPIEVSATGRCYLREFVQDVAFVSLSYPGNLMAHVHASWLDPHKFRTFTVVGTKKMAVFDDMNPTEKIRIYDKGVDWKKNVDSFDAFLSVRQGDIHIPQIDFVEPLKKECLHFIECIKSGTHPLTDGLNGLQVLSVLAAAQKSLEHNGRPQRVRQT